MDDKALLELAAKAAGYHWPLVWPYPSQVDVPHDWNPLTDDGDALRLAVRLALTIQCACVDDYGREYVRVDHYPNSGEPATVSVEEYGCDEAATRSAIVRAAAEIGRNTAPPQRKENNND